MYDLSDLLLLLLFLSSLINIILLLSGVVNAVNNKGNSVTHEWWCSVEVRRFEKLKKREI